MLASVWLGSALLTTSQATAKVTGPPLLGAGMIYKGMSYKGTGKEREEGTRVCEAMWDDGTIIINELTNNKDSVIDMKVKPQQMSAQQQSAPQQLLITTLK